MTKPFARGAVLALWIASAASAEPTRDDPANPASFAPPLRFDSAFAGYRPLGEEAVGRWRDVNDRVREAAAQRGGHAHAQGTTSPSTPAAPPPSTPPRAVDGAKR